MDNDALYSVDQFQRPFVAALDRLGRLAPAAISPQKARDRFSARAKQIRMLNL